MTQCRKNRVFAKTRSALRCVILSLTARLGFLSAATLAGSIRVRAMGTSTRRARLPIVRLKPREMPFVATPHRMRHRDRIKFASDSRMRFFMAKTLITILGDASNELPQNGQLALA
ncbi:hypothetical protein D3C72_1880850 [compost metagenome]